FHGRAPQRRDLSPRRCGHREAGRSGAGCRRAALRTRLGGPAEPPAASCASIAPRPGAEIPRQETTDGPMTRDTSQLGKVWAERMTKSERDTSFPDSEPRDAATMMLIDRSAPAPKVLLGRRHHGHKFMPGKFVFPGGRIEPHDAAMSIISDLHPDIQAKLNTRVASPSA